MSDELGAGVQASLAPMGHFNYGPGPVGQAPAPTDATATIQRYADDAGVIQRVGNEINFGDLLSIHAIINGLGTPLEKRTALEQSASPTLWYGREAKTDEQVEITASASYLNQKKQNWVAERLRRAGGQAEQWQSWETFQYEMNHATPGEDPNATPWFMQPAIGYAVTDARVGELANIGTQRNTPDPDDPQQLLGLTYQRDTMFISDSPAMANQRRAVGHASLATDLTVGDVFILRDTANGHELRLRITGVGGIFGSLSTVRGTVLPCPHPNGGIAVGTDVTVQKGLFSNDMTVTITATGASAGGASAGAWTAATETWGYHQAWTRPNDALGAHVNGAMQNVARNRGAGNPLNNATYDQIRNRYHTGGDRSSQRTLGPHRTRMNVEDLGWNIRIAPYRRLGGDAIFTEAAHPAPAAYRNELQPAGAVDVSNPDWYFDLANAMPNRFVGGRSNSTLRYMAAATMLYHSGRLSLADASDILAFVIADMVVSGEHSMPECMATVVMAAGSSEPWSGMPVNIATPTSTINSWLKLIDTPTKQAMYDDDRTQLMTLLSSNFFDSVLVKVLVILDKLLYNNLQGG